MDLMWVVVGLCVFAGAVGAIAAALGFGFWQGCVVGGAGLVAVIVAKEML